MGLHDRLSNADTRGINAPMGGVLWPFTAAVKISQVNQRIIVAGQLKSVLTIHGSCSVGFSAGRNSPDGLEDHLWPRRRPLSVLCPVAHSRRWLDVSTQSFVGSIKCSRKAIVFGSLLSLLQFPVNLKLESVTGYETDRGSKPQSFLFAMDPITAFSLACGVIQVVDFSLNVVGKCREIYRDGTTTEHLGQVPLVMAEIESLCVI